MSDNKQYRNFLKWVLCLVFLWNTNPTFGQQLSCQLRFEQLSESEGLSNGQINGICQDELGFIWIATDDGINRFDGQEILIIRPLADDSAATGFERATAIAHLGDSKLLVGGNRGQLEMIDQQEGKLIERAYSQLAGKRIDAIANADKLIYILTENELYQLPGSFDPADSLQLVMSKEEAGRFLFMEKDELGIVWLSTNNGLYLARGNGKFVKVKRSRNIKAIDIHLKEKDYWLISDQKLYKMNSQLNLQEIPLSGLGDVDFNFHSVMDLGSQVLVGNSSSGMWSYDEQYNSFSSCTGPESSYPFYSSVSSSFVSKESHLFLGTQGDGIYYANTGSTYSNFHHNKIAEQRFYNAAQVFRRGEETFCLSGQQVFRFHDNGATSSQLLNYPVDMQTTDFLVIDSYYVISGPSGIWIFNENGLQVDHLKKDETELSLSNNYVFRMLIHDNRIYAATANGVSVINFKSGLSNRLVYNESSPIEIMDLFPYDQAVFALSKDGVYRLGGEGSVLKLNLDLSAGNDMLKLANVLFIQGKDLWIGTRDKGLHRFILDGNSASFLATYDVSTGLSSNQIMGLSSAGSTELWISTSSGLNLLQLDQDRLIRYYESDGLVSHNFNEHEFIRGSENLLLLGSRRGLIYFDPKNIQTIFNPPSLVLTDIMIGGNRQEVLRTPFKKEISVPYLDYTFSLKFSSLDYGRSEKSTYAYRLLGQSDEWISLSNNNSVAFSSLRPGVYQLQIKAYDSHGVESNDRLSLQLTIVPPFYNTLWFRILIIVLIVGFGVGIYIYRINLVRRRNRWLAQEVDKRTEKLRKQNTELEIAKEEAQASDKAKSEFMATVSHEIRTPMNGILGSVSVLNELKLSQDQREHLNIISEAGDNMLAIINEILDYAKIESGKMDAILQEFYFIESFKNAMESHALRAANKEISFHCFIDPAIPHKLVSDKSRISQVLNNLVGNAIKFTRTGLVSVRVGMENQGDGEFHLRFEIRDTGVGIPEEKQSKVWDAFSQADSSSTREFGGTGLGLAIARSIVNILQGEIWLESKEGIGSLFTFIVPVKGVPRRLDTPDQLKGKKLLCVSENPELCRNMGLYCREFGLEYSELTELSKLGAVGDFGTIDFLMIDQHAATYDFAEPLREMAKKSILIVSGSFESKNYETEFDELVKLPVWREQFMRLIGLEMKPENADRSKVELADGISSAKIMLAEDNKVNRMVTSRIFTKLGLKLDMAEDGKQAVEMFREGNHDLILMDLLMPVMDGKTATREIRSLSGENQRPIIIAFSANIFNTEKEEFIELGFNDVLSKPAKLEDVQRVLNEHANGLVQA